MARYKSIIAIIVLSFFISYSIVPPAKANEVALGAGMVALVCAGLGAAGVAIQNGDNTAAIAQAAWDGMSSATQEALDEAYANAVEGIVTIHMGAQIVSDFISGANAAITGCENGDVYTVTAGSGSGTALETTAQVAQDLPNYQGAFYGNVSMQNNDTDQRFLLKDSVTGQEFLSVQLCNAWYYSPPPGYGCQRWQVLGEYGTYSVIATGVAAETLTSGVYEPIKVGISMIDNTVEFYINDALVHTMVTDHPYVMSRYILWGGAAAGTYEFPLTTEVELAPGDITVDEDKKVAFPPTWGGTDVTVDTNTGAWNGTVVNPPTTIPTGIETNTWLGNIWQILNNTLNSVKTSLLSIVASITALTAAPTVAIDWTPIRTIGTGFSTLFPFSLPWDLSRILTSFNASEWNGQVAIAAHSVLANFDFIIDFAWFNDIRSVVKGLEVVCFDLGLIFITRKLLGGAS